MQSANCPQSHRSSDHPKYPSQRKRQRNVCDEAAKDPEWIWRIAKLHRNGQSPREKTRTEVLQVETVKELPTKIRQMFGNYGKEPMVYLTRLRYFDDEPMTVENLYVLKRYLEKSPAKSPKIS